MTIQSTKPETQEQASFRKYCREWLRHNIPSTPAIRLPNSALEIVDPAHMSYLQQWQQAAFEAGLVGCDYPEALGGGGRKDCQRVANEEMRAAGAPFLPNLVGLGMAAPTLYYHATDELKRRLLPRIFSGEDIWCQGFSEPEAGSDLANVQTFAEWRGDRWIINGHKVWTSLAHFAEWMILLLRTDRMRKYEGLSYFVVPIRASIGRGVKVSPLVKMTGEGGFNQVIFDDLEVEDCYRLDEIGRGWQVAMTTLLHERGAGELQTPESGEGPEKSAAIDSQALIDLATQSLVDGRPASADPCVRDRIVQMAIREQALARHGQRAAVPALNDHPMRLSLQHKLLTSELQQDIAALALDIAGARGGLYVNDINAPAGGRWPHAYMNSFGFTIAAGTSEVQRNILGERVLNMPKSK